MINATIPGLDADPASVNAAGQMKKNRGLTLMEAHKADCAHLEARLESTTQGFDVEDFIRDNATDEELLPFDPASQFLRALTIDTAETLQAGDLVLASLTKGRPHYLPYRVGPVDIDRYDNAMLTPCISGVPQEPRSITDFQVAGVVMDRIFRQKRSGAPLYWK